MSGISRFIFRPISAFPRGTLLALLSDAYSFDRRCADCWHGNWHEFDTFFFDHPEIADRCGFFTAAPDGEAIGFVSWDPRRSPEFVEIGHNCVAVAFQGRGVGTMQLREAVRRIAAGTNARKIRVTTSELLRPAQRMYEKTGFRQTGHENCGDFSGDRLHYELPLPLKGDLT